MAYPTVEQIDARMAALRKERREAVERERKADRAARAEVQGLVGDLVLSMFPGGWRTVDPHRLASAIEANSFLFSPVEEKPVEDARKLWATWSRERKAARKSAKDGVGEPAPPVAGGQGASSPDSGGGQEVRP